MITTMRDGLRFMWDPAKSRANTAKHGVTFIEAATVFGDPNALTIPDPKHSDEEDREITLGQSQRRRLIVVSHTERDGSVRIISARTPTRRESGDYNKQPQPKE